VTFTGEEVEEELELAPEFETRLEARLADDQVGQRLDKVLATPWMGSRAPAFRP
jgi:hypothetical protein